MNGIFTNTHASTDASKWTTASILEAMRKVQEALPKKRTADCVVCSEQVVAELTKEFLPRHDTLPVEMPFTLYGIPLYVCRTEAEAFVKAAEFVQQGKRVLLVKDSKETLELLGDKMGDFLNQFGMGNML